MLSDTYEGERCLLSCRFLYLVGIVIQRHLRSQTYDLNVIFGSFGLVSVISRDSNKMFIGERLLHAHEVLNFVPTESYHMIFWPRFSVKIFLFFFLNQIWMTRKTQFCMLYFRHTAKTVKIKNQFWSVFFFAWTFGFDYLNWFFSNQKLIKFIILSYLFEFSLQCVN